MPRHQRGFELSNLTKHVVEPFVVSAKQSNHERQSEVFTTRTSLDAERRLS